MSVGVLGRIRQFKQIWQKDGTDVAINRTENYFKWYIIKIYKRILYRTACDIHRKVPKSTKFPHPIGIVIGLNVVLGENVKIHQNVTLGSDVDSGEHPIIGDNVVICSGAVVIGEVKIGDNSVVGANSVVLSDIPPNSTAVGAPAKIVKSHELSAGAVDAGTISGIDVAADENE